MWRRLLTQAMPRSHITQFYQDTGFLQRVFGVWLGASLHNWGGAVLLTSPRNWKLAETALSELGLSPGRLQEQGRLVRLDAQEFLERFLETGEPDPTVFDRMVRSALSTVGASCDPKRVRAWGEAVELLRQHGRLHEAQVLEELWNTAIDEYGFSLLCSYQVDNLDPVNHQDRMGHLTDAHSVLIPDEDYLRLNDAVDRALVDLYGAEKASSIWSQVWTRRVSPAAMPEGEAVLSWFSRSHPKEAERLFSRTRAHYAALRE